jgi:hypothetical protein
MVYDSQLFRAGVHEALVVPIHVDVLQSFCSQWPDRESVFNEEYCHNISAQHGGLPVVFLPTDSMKAAGVMFNFIYSRNQDYLIQELMGEVRPPHTPPPSVGDVRLHLDQLGRLCASLGLQDFEMNNAIRRAGDLLMERDPKDHM